MYTVVDLDLEKDQAALISKAKWWPRKLPIIWERCVWIPEYPREYSATGGYSEQRGVCRLRHTPISSGWKGRYMKLESRSFDSKMEGWRQNKQGKFGQISDFGENFQGRQGYHQGRHHLPCHIAGYVPDPSNSVLINFYPLVLPGDTADSSRFLNYYKSTFNQSNLRMYNMFCCLLPQISE